MDPMTSKYMIVSFMVIFTIIILFSACAFAYELIVKYIVARELYKNITRKKKEGSDSVGTPFGMGQDFVILQLLH